MSYLRYLCLFAYSGVQHILCCVFVLFFFVSGLFIFDCPFGILYYFFYVFVQETVTVLVEHNADVDIINAEGFLAKDLSRTKEIKQLIEGLF